jgi:hypothetical protein
MSMKTNEILTQCCCCHKYEYNGQWQIEKPFETEEISHTYCPEDFKKAMAEVEEI